MGVINYDLWRNIIESVTDHLRGILPDDVMAVYLHGGMVDVVRTCCGKRERSIGTILFTTASVVLVDDIYENCVRTDVYYSDPDMLDMVDNTVLLWIANDKS